MVDSFICVTWLIHTCDMTHSYVWHDSFICVTWLIHTCDMTHSYVWHDSFICVTWLIHMCGRTHSYVWHDWFICVAGLIHMCDMTHSYVRHDSSILFWAIIAPPTAPDPVVRCWGKKKDNLGEPCDNSVTGLIRCRVHSYLWNDWLLHIYGMVCWYVWHESSILFLAIAA